MRLVREGYSPIKNFEFIDNQLVAESVVEMWYTTFVNNFYVTVQICIIVLRQCCFFKNNLPQQIKQLNSLILPVYQADDNLDHCGHFVCMALCDRIQIIIEHFVFR